MRVLMLTWEYPPNIVGGLGKHVMDIVPALAEEGVEVHVITPRLRGGAAYSREAVNIHVYRVDPPIAALNDFFSIAWQTNLKLQDQAFRLVEDYQKRGMYFDLVHVHEWLVAFAGGALKQHYQIPLLATIHATERGRGRGALPGDLARAINNVEWWLTYESWRAICCSQYMISEVHEYFNSPVDKVDMIANGVNADRFDILRETNLAAFRLGYATPDQKIIFHVGRIVDEKGVRVLIECAPKVLENYPKAKFVIAGTGPGLPDYRALVSSMGLSDNFYFTGFISDDMRDKLYLVADVAAFPSLYEPFGIVALEAMAAKTPVVVADTGGLSEVVTNHETGISVFPGNPESLAWGILHTLNNSHWSEARVQNAYKMVRELYNWHLIARQTLKVYQRIVAEFNDSAWGQERQAKIVANLSPLEANPPELDGHKDVYKEQLRIKPR